MSPEDKVCPTGDLVFMVLDCCQNKRTPHLALCPHLAHHQVPELRMYGMTREGHSVLARVHGFEPYLWIEAPCSGAWSKRWEEPMRRQLNSILMSVTNVSDCIVRVETHQRQSLMYYTGGVATSFLKLVTQLPQHVPKIKAVVSERGFSLSPLFNDVRCFATYESNVIFPLRFLVDAGINGCSWVTLPHGTYLCDGARWTTCAIEVDVAYGDIKTHDASTGEFMAIAPFRILSIDIECCARKGHFPEAQHDPIIQIANHMHREGTPEEDDVKCVFTLDTCSPIAGAEVKSYDTEAEMLVAWAAFMVQTDPDVITGYNIIGFDLPYLLDRADALGIAPRFSYWSRQMATKTEQREKKFQSKQMGNREYVEIAIEGRVVLDVMTVIQREYKLRSYSLNSVSHHFLGEQKEDVHHTIIGDLQRGDAETRHRLAVYCLKDAYLPVRLLTKLLLFVNNVEMSRVSGVPIGWLLERGQQIKVFSQMLRKAQRKGLLFPTNDYQLGATASGGKQDKVGYEGATVIEPERGFYRDEPIVTLDFASLYPSIMQAHNLCYSTLIPPTDVGKYDAAMVTTTPSGDHFVKKELFRGILPEILEEFLVARKRAKGQMKEARTAMEYAVLNGRQMALKVSANSVYGFTGAQVGKLPCLEISASVTSFGRAMILKTKSIVELQYPHVKVIYGDTDSVMIRCPSSAEKVLDDTEVLRCAMAFGKEAADAVTSVFEAPIKLEFEKVYHPFLLMNKKRYAGLLWTKVEKFDKLDAKGIETVRRDTCPLVANLISGVLNRILIQRSVESAVDYVKSTISDLLLNRLDISQLVITKCFSKPADEYANKQAHVCLVEKKRKRDVGTEVSIGDRIAYVIVKGAKGAKVCERSEDPIYALENNIPLDTQYYLDNQLSQPLQRVFESVIPDCSVLLKGEHMLHISVAPPSKETTMLGKFCKVQPQCLVCKVSLPSSLSTTTTMPLCVNCVEQAPDVYCRVLAVRNHFAVKWASVTAECQRCQGSLLQEVICTNGSCPVFYMRKRVQIDLNEQQKLIDRFGVVSLDW